MIFPARIIDNDKVIPPKLVRQDAVYKKCENVGESLRYLSLGIKQMIISRDKEMAKIVNLIPIEYGKILVDCDTDSKSNNIPHSILAVTIKNAHRTFVLRLSDPSVINDWLEDYKKIIDNTHEYSLRQSKELFSYLVRVWEVF